MFLVTTVIGEGLKRRSVVASASSYGRLQWDGVCVGPTFAQGSRLVMSDDVWTRQGDASRMLRPHDGWSPKQHCVQRCEENSTRRFVRCAIGWSNVPVNAVRLVGKPTKRKSCDQSQHSKVGGQGRPCWADAPTESRMSATNFPHPSSALPFPAGWGEKRLSLGMCSLDGGLPPLPGANCAGRPAGAAKASNQNQPCGSGCEFGEFGAFHRIVRTNIRFWECQSTAPSTVAILPPSEPI